MSDVHPDIPNPNRPGANDARSPEIESLLDGTESEEGRARLNEAAARDSEIRSQMNLQNRIDASLRMQFEPPKNLSLPVFAPIAKVRPTARTRSNWHRWAIAAVLMLGLSGAIIAGWFLWEGRTRSFGRLASLEDSYKTEVASGFEPYWVCKDDAEFSGTFAKRFGTALHMKNMDTASAAGWGLDYKNTITHKTVALLARVDSQPVMVFIDLASKDKGQPAPTNPALHMFKRIVGPYVLYELTPLDSPKVENDLYIQ